MNLCLDEEFVLGLLKYSGKSFPYKQLSRFFKWVCSKKEFRITTSTLDEVGNLIKEHSDAIDVYAVWELVKEIGEKEDGLLNTEILNDFLCAFSSLGSVKVALEVYGKFDEFGCIRDGMTYWMTIELLCTEFDCDNAIIVCQNMPDTGMLPQGGWHISAIIRLLCEGDRVKSALAIHLAASDVSEYKMSNYARSMLVCCLSKEDETVHFAQQILGKFPAKVREEFYNSFLWVIRGLCRIKDIESAKKLLFEMIEKGPSPGPKVFGCVIECLSEAGYLEDASEILKLAERKVPTPNISSYSVLMNGYAKEGSMEKAYKVLVAAKRKHTKLCRVSLYTLIQGYCKLGEFEKALKLFSEMKKFGVVPGVNDYYKLIQSLSLCLKDLDKETTQNTLEEMREKCLYIPYITESLIYKS